MNVRRPGSWMLAAAAGAFLSLTAVAQDNPYTPVENWAKMPEGRTWGSTSAVDIAPDGRSIWVAERCGQNSCLDSDLDPVLLFDQSGKLVRSFGRGLIVWPHGIHVDREGNVWVTDARDNRPSRPRGAPPDSPLPPAPAKIIGHQVFKFSPEGKVLMALGAPGGGTGSEGFMQPNDVITAPNGDIWVAEGHGGKSDRLVKFDRTGKFIAEFGRKGTGPGEFDQPHALAFDSKGRLFVADRSNNRIQIFDQSGKFLEQWTQFSRPSGLFIDSKDVLYAADSESGSIDPKRTDWKRGIYIGRISDGKIFALIPDPDVNAKGTSAAEGVAVDAAGNIYGAEVGPRRLMKYTPKR
jgi:sugar lactone lactonase YvrE